MLRLSILAGAFAAAMSAEARPSVGQEDYADALVMVGAHWCAPCMLEIRRLPELAAAAAPERIMLGWVDHPVALSQMPGHPTSLPPDVAGRLARDIAGDGYGLPFSVMFNRRGDACAVRRSPLAPEDIAGMRSQCAASR